MQRDSEFCSLVGRLVIAGGTVNTPGRVSPVADFNFYCDPLSARRVIKSSATKTLIPLDVSSEMTFTFELLSQLPAGIHACRQIPPTDTAVRLSGAAASPGSGTHHLARPGRAGGGHQSGTV